MYKPAPSAYELQDTDLQPSFDGVYDPYSLHAAAPKLSPKRLNRTHRPQYLSLSGSSYDEELLYDPYKPTSRTPNTATSETDFLRTPQSALFPTGRPHPRRRHPFADSFEPPEWWLILSHVAFCALGYPVLFAFVTIATDRPIFWSRLIVGVGCSVVGVALGSTLARLAQRFLEAATWATLIHQSRNPSKPGIRMRDFASSSESATSIMAGLTLLWNRHTRYGGTLRSSRVHYDARPWSLYLVAFLFIAIVAASISFILGRVVDIQAAIEHQTIDYQEIAIAGDLSDADLAKAAVLNSEAFDSNFAITWTLSPFSAHSSLPNAVSFIWENDTVYFAETTLSQLLPGGTGFGTFDANTTTASIQQNSTQLVATSGDTVQPGWTLRYPRWGLRIQCAKSADPNTILPRAAGTGFTYAFTPRDILEGMFSSFGMALPASLAAPLNVSAVMLSPNDTFPAALDPANISMAAAFNDNGVAHSFKSVPISEGDDGNGFISIESLLIRLNTTYAPDGKFLTYSAESIANQNGTQTFIGYDAAVCLEVYESYVLEVYNSTIGNPASTRIVSKGNTIVDLLNTEVDTRPLNDPSVKRVLNSTNLRQAYEVAHGNSANQILKDNGRDSFYVPSPTIVSFTGGDGPYGYLELSAPYFAQARARADATNLLSYLAGSAPSLARSYPDRVTSYAVLSTVEAAVVFAVLLVLGLLAGFFVPRLPLAIPRRGFGLYSWLAAFYSNELVLERMDARTESAGTPGLPKHLDLQDIKRHMGDLRFRYGVAS
ncbi:hypothetical protein HMN09_00493300 [Mycena chlorophos]|uniref:Uncharacterized protein n=1 Tax=Mycena chlorophos TaxID=658473 RepID=A0A8H6TAX0_MYCCL|nr:hypothetical protein HMN09_00493300 [Mycena chlorophos]